MVERNVPKGWKRVRLGDVVSLRRDPVSPKQASNLPYVGLEHIDSGQANLPRWGKASEVTSLKSRFFKSDILYGKLRPYLDKAVVAPMDGICSTDIIVLKHSEGVLPEFAAQVLHTRDFISFANSTTTGIHHPRTSWNAIQEFEFGLPSTSEQNQIGHALSVMQKMRMTSGAILDALYEFRKSLLQHIFTCGPIPVQDINRVTLQDTSLGPLPEDWQVVPLQSVVKSYKNGIYKPAEFYGKGNPSARMFNIRDGLVSLEGAPLLSVTDEELEDFGLREGDVLVNRVNSGDLVGKAGLVPAGIGPATFESKNIRIRVDTTKLVSAYFVMWTLTPHYITEIRQMVRAAVGQATINQGDLGRILIPLPPLEVQRKAEQAFVAVEMEIRAEKQRLGSVIDTFKVLSFELLNGLRRFPSKGE